jgi:hypothetical protein
MELSGFRVPPHATSAEFLHQRGGIHEIRPRREMARTLARYLGIYHRVGAPNAGAARNAQ